MEKLKDLFLQFALETITIMLSIIIGVLEFVKNRNVTTSILWILMMLILYLVIRFIFLPVLNIIISKKRGKVLHLSRIENRICMIPKKQKKEGMKYFISDIKDILAFAEKKKIKEMKTTTHEVLVKFFIKDYAVGNKHEIIKHLNEMNINDTYEIKATFGKILITYNGNKINNCNRYKFGKLTFKDCCKEKKEYDMIFYLQQ